MNILTLLNYIDEGINMSIFQIIDENTKKLPFYINSIGFNEFQNPVYRPEGFNYNHLISVIDGNGTVECNGEKIPVTKGDIIFIRKRIPHNYYSSGKNFKTQWVTIDGISCDSVFSSQNVKNFKIIKDVNLDKLNDNFDNLYEKTAKLLNCYELSIHIYSYLITFFNCEKNTEYYTNIQKVVDYIKENFSLPITLDELSNISTINKFTLCREFKKIYNVTIFDFILRVRVQNAKTLLADSSMNVQDIAVSCGFNDCGYFCRKFKKEEKCTPTEFRNSIKKDG